jgi:hypothetical protein
MGRTGRFWQSGLFSVGLFALMGVVGCQPDNNTTSSGGNGGSDGGSSTGGSDGGSSTGGSDGGSATGGSATGGSSTGGSATGGGGSGGADPCSDDAIDATVYDVNNPDSPNAVGEDIKVKLDGVIAMSHKHLISKSKMTGSCLWGVFVSAPTTENGQQLTETAPYSGVIVLSYGDKAPTPDDPCPTGTDAIAEDVQPGDVLTVIGTTSNFILMSCGNFMSDSNIPQKQIFNSCLAKKTGTAAVPAPHVLTPAEITLLAKQKTTDGPDVAKAHEAWGGVKLRAENVPSDPWKGQNGNPDSIVGPFGKVKLAPGGLEVPDGFYYVGGSAEVCETAPQFDDQYTLPFTWDHVQGFHYLAFCTWSLANEDKCADFAPQSPDCAAANIDACYAN